MTYYLIERVKMAKSYLSPSLRDELVSCGESIVRPLIKILPSLPSYLVTADVLEVLGRIGGPDAYRALTTLLEDAPVGNLPKRLMSQSCVKGLVEIADEASINSIINVLTFNDSELRFTAIDALARIAQTRPEFRQVIIVALVKAWESESFEKPGKLLEDTLDKLGQSVPKKQSWPNQKTGTTVIQPVSVIAPPPPVIRPSVYSTGSPVSQAQTCQNTFVNQSLELSQYPLNQTCNTPGMNKYAILTEEQEKEVLDKLLTSPDEKEKLSIIKELGNSGNIRVVDELLTVVKTTDNKVIRNAAVDAILKIAPNDMKLRFMVLEYVLDKRVIGQVEAKNALANALRVAQIGLKRTATSNKPIGSFLFVGPTGVGKTELAKALAEALYGSELQLIRLDMSEYTDMADKNKLIGSPPGYAGCDEGGRLTQEVLKKPQSVVLFDEIEKAHFDIFNLFLQVIDDGRLTDSKGITVSFRDTIIIMTSNVGSREILEGINAKLEPAEIKELVKEASKVAFKPEFLNRLNDIIIFTPLTADELLQVLNLKLNPTAKSLSDKYQLILEVTDAAKNYIIQSTQKQEFGFSPRELTRIIDNEIVHVLSEKLLDYEIAESYQGKSVIPRGGKVVVDIKDSKLSIEIMSNQ